LIFIGVLHVECRMTSSSTPFQTNTPIGDSTDERLDAFALHVKQINEEYWSCQAREREQYRTKRALQRKMDFINRTNANRTGRLITMLLQAPDGKTRIINDDVMPVGIPVVFDEVNICYGNNYYKVGYLARETLKTTKYCRTSTCTPCTRRLLLVSIMGGWVFRDCEPDDVIDYSDCPGRENLLCIVDSESMLNGHEATFTCGSVWRKRDHFAPLRASEKVDLESFPDLTATITYSN